MLDRCGLDGVLSQERLVGGHLAGYGLEEPHRRETRPGLVVRALKCGVRGGVYEVPEDVGDSLSLWERAGVRAASEPIRTLTRAPRGLINSQGERRSRLPPGDR
jgi:hypothetical protein